MLPASLDQSKAVAAATRRSERFAARHALWDESSLPRVQNCGRARQDSTAGVSVVVTTGADGARVAGYGNLQTCGSVWACPVCSAKIAAHRQGEISRALAAWLGRDGGRVAMATFTMSHVAGQRLKTLWDALSVAWHAVASGGGWADDRMAHGSMYLREVKRGKHKGESVVDWRIPTIRVVEVTYGDHGWHVHIHTLLLLPKTATAESVHDLGARMFGRWKAALVREKMRVPSQRRGWDMTLLKGDSSAPLADYFVKAVYQASMEVARGDMKTARYGNRTPFAVLAGLVALHASGEMVGDDDLGVWAEWERGSKGRRQIAWSAGLREELLAGEVELTDDEAAELDAGGVTEIEMDPDTWQAVQAARADYRVLRAFEASRREGLALLMALSPDADLIGDARMARLDEWGQSRSKVRVR